MTKEEIVEKSVKLAVENNLVIEVYDILHDIVVEEMRNLKDRADTANAELRLIKKFADANKLGVIKDILKD